MTDTLGYKTFVITQKIKELTKKLGRLARGTADWIETKTRIENLKKDLEQS